MDHVSLRITGLECTASTRLAIERRLAALPGITGAYVNPVTETVYVERESDRFSEGRVRAVLGSFGARVLRSWSESEAARGAPMLES